MIESFFQSLEQEHVDYLLIGGQAAVLYGAATFSEDVDLWINPTAKNAAALLAALHVEKATYYKLTPPLTEDFMRRGHAFHFCVPDTPEFYLDVMGKPPRVPDFDAAKAEAAVIPSAWGAIPTIGMQHLVALKTTQRLSDYPVIGQLVLGYLQAREGPDDMDFAWAVSNVYTVEDFDDLLASHPETRTACQGARELREYADRCGEDAGADESARDAAERFLSERILHARRADREYWRTIIAELRVLRREDRLMPVGRRVTSGDTPSS